MNSLQKYSVNQYLVNTLLTYVQTGEIAIPEIQRPFVWSPAKVRDLIDSLYRGFPVGYIVTWQSPTVRLKDGSSSSNKKILIDGQQRVTALAAAILGQTVKNADYEDIRIKIAFNPLEKKFEVSNSVIEKNAAWIPDIAPLLSGEAKPSRVRKEYCERNPDVDEDELDEILESLRDVTKKQIGVIELAGDLDIDSVTDIFIRINSQGVPLSQADFVMSKIAANTAYGGHLLRKCIDHFCHLSQKPEFFEKLRTNDEEFAASEYFGQMAWRRHELEDLYAPNYVDMLRVVFTYKFSRGKIGDLVGLLSGRNFQTREYETAIEEETYRKLREGLLEFINETNFKRFLMVVRSAGFCDKWMIRSRSALNFSYIVFLKLRSLKVPPEQIEKYVRKWLVMSILTARYSGSAETQFEQDIKQIGDGDFESYLRDQEKARLSDAFWNEGLVQELNASSTTHAYMSVFFASQCKMNKRGFLSSSITVKDLIEQKGDIHHIFPRKYLIENGKTRGQYNQLANYVYAQTEVNIQIGKKPPEEYLGYMLGSQCSGAPCKFGGIVDRGDFEKNLEENCIPLEACSMGIGDYEEFLQKRRVLMAARLKEYYQSL